MTTAFLRPLPRTLLIGALALLGTISSFVMTTAPVLAAERPVYTVTLASPLDAPRREIIDGTMWRCEDTRCAAPAKGERALSLCGKVARQFGEVARFDGPKGELESADLAKCNAAVIKL